METDVGQKLESLHEQLEKIKDMKNCFQSEGYEELLDSLICKCLETIQEIRSNVCNSMQVSLPAQMVSDPSIQFFGIDWCTLFSKLEHLKRNIRIWEKTSESGLLENILCALLTIEDQISQHSVAVLSGSLEKKKLREQEMMQRRVALMAKSGENSKKTGKIAREQSSIRSISLVHFVCNKFRSKM